MKLVYPFKWHPTAQIGTDGELLLEDMEIQTISRGNAQGAEIRFYKIVKHNINTQDPDGLLQDAYLQILIASHYLHLGCEVRKDLGVLRDHPVKYLYEGSVVPKVVNGLAPYMCSETEDVATISMSAEVSTRIPKEELQNQFKAALDGLDSLKANPALILALELANMARLQSFEPASFLLNMASIESLLPTNLSPEFTVNLVRNWETELDSAIKKEGDETVKRAMQNFKQRVLELKRASISSRFKEFVVQFHPTFDDLNSIDGQRFKKAIKNAYSVRSNLLHSGKYDSVELHDANWAVTKLLASVFSSKLVPRSTNDGTVSP